MECNQYQYKARSTAIYPGKGDNLWYPALGLAGEAGEVAEKVKKVYRDHGGVVDPMTRETLILELGDVLWYVANLAVEIGATLDDVAIANIAKLSAREEKGTLQGSGDER